MYVRIITIKCPNETAKKALKLLNKIVAQEQMKVGLRRYAPEARASITDQRMISNASW